MNASVILLSSKFWKAIARHCRQLPLPPRLSEPAVGARQIAYRPRAHSGQIVQDRRILLAYAPSHSGLLEPRGTNTVLNEPGVRDIST